MKFKKISGLSSIEFQKEVKRRQSLSAKRTTAIKKQRTAIKIKIAIDILIRKKKLLTIKNLARYAKISTSTIRRHIKIIQLFTQKSTGFICSIRLIVQRAKRICTGNLNEPIMLFYQKNVFRKFSKKDINHRSNQNIRYLQPDIKLSIIYFILLFEIVKGVTNAKTYEGFLYQELQRVEVLLVMSI